MKLRVARHTANLPAMVEFYQHLGLVTTGNFEGHDQYDGVFLSHPGADWELEFTASQKVPQHQPDEDDLLVLYAESKAAYEELTEKLATLNLPVVVPKNPYWLKKGTTYLDPDGYRVVIATRPEHE